MFLVFTFATTLKGSFVSGTYMWCFRELSEFRFFSLGLYVDFLQNKKK